MLAPKRRKYRKEQNGRNTGVATRGNRHKSLYNPILAYVPYCCMSCNLCGVLVSPFG